MKPAAELPTLEHAQPTLDDYRRLEALSQRFESIVNTAGEFFTLIDERFTYRTVNDAYCRAHGKPRQEFIGRTVAEVWGEELFAATLRPKLEKCFAGAEQHYRARFEFPQTGLRHFAVSLYPHAGRDGVRHAIVVTRDVTAQHRAEEQMRLVLGLTKAVSRATDFASALAHTLRDVCALTGWSLGQAWVPGADGEFLEGTPACQVNAAGLEVFCVRNRDRRWRRGEGLPGRAWAARQALWLPDLSADQVYSRAALARQLGLRAALAIPVLAEGEVVAVMEFLLAAPSRDDERLMGVVSAVAAQLGALFLRRKSEAALEISEQRYSALVETANDVIFYLTPDGRLAALNQAFETLTGWSRAEWLGQHFAPLLHPEDAPVAIERLRAILAGDPPQRREYRIRRRDGSHAVGEFMLAPEIKDGKSTGIFGIGRDVTERKRAEEQLDRFFNRSLDLHCLAGFDGFLKRVNAAWTATLGYTSEELRAQPYLALVYPDDRPILQQELERLQQGTDAVAFELRCVCKDGTIKWTLWNATPLLHQQLIIATGRDITKRKRAETAMQQSEDHYRELFHQAYQMQEHLRQLSNRILAIQEQERARISRDLHDEVGQALTAINVNLAVLKKTLPANDTTAAARIADTQGLLEQTMETVHRFSRELRPAMLDDLGLLPALRSYVKVFTERTGIAVKLDAAHAEEIERLDADRKTVIYRVVQEGLNNIAKHAKAQRVDIAAHAVSDTVRLEIRDDGQGFKTADKPVKRLGLLGLEERVRLVNGEFAVASEPGRGTVLRAAIPFKPH
jgi:PAS domain S-box-containing protein